MDKNEIKHNRENYLYYKWFTLELEKTKISAQLSLIQLFGLVELSFVSFWNNNCNNIRSRFTLLFLSNQIEGKEYTSAMFGSRKVLGKEKKC